MKKKSISSIGLLVLCMAVIAGYGLITVDSAYAGTEAVNQANVQRGRGAPNAFSPAGSTYLVKFKNPDGTTTWALYRKVNGFGSFQFQRISQPVVTGADAEAPDVPIDPNLEREAEEAMNSLGSRAGGGGGSLGGNEYDPMGLMNDSLTFPPGAVIVINGSGKRRRGRVTCDPACTG